MMMIGFKFGAAATGLGVRVSDSALLLDYAQASVLCSSM